LQIGIPTLHCYNRLAALLTALDNDQSFPFDLSFTIIDNGGRLKASRWMDAIDQLNSKVVILVPSRNLGVSASFNLITRRLGQCFIASDDIAVTKADLSLMVDASASCPESIFICHQEGGFTVFWVNRPDAWLAMGGFDENFYPAYYEDNDAMRRLELAGFYMRTIYLDLSTVIDIGGNDGTLLNTFRTVSSKYKFWSGKPPQEFINVDMGANLREANEATGNKFICGQFNENMDLPAANLIVSTNVFQHTQDIHSFLRGIVKFLDGVWVLEFPYTLTTLLTNQFDQFYHEHYYYWLLSPLIKLFHHYGLKIHLQELPIHGGTMRLWMTNKETSAAEITPLLDDYKRKESLIDFSAFQVNCTSHMQKSKNFLSCLEGRIAFFGAAAKGCVFLNALGLSIENMPNAFIIDDTPEKQGMFVPGTGFEIHPRSVLDEQTVDNIIILPHNFARYIASTLRPAFNGGIYTMLPSIASF
jgi:hypothetical protein